MIARILEVVGITVGIGLVGRLLWYLFFELEDYR